MLNKSSLVFCIIFIFAGCAFAKFGVEVQYGAYESSNNDFSNIDKMGNIVKREYNDTSNSAAGFVFYEYMFPEKEKKIFGIKIGYRSYSTMSMDITTDEYIRIKSKSEVYSIPVLVYYKLRPVNIFSFWFGGGADYIVNKWSTDFDSGSIQIYRKQKVIDINLATGCEFYIFKHFSMGLDLVYSFGQMFNNDDLTFNFGYGHKSNLYREIGGEAVRLTARYYI